MPGTDISCKAILKSYMPLKVQYPLPPLGLELYQLGVHTRAKNVFFRSFSQFDEQEYSSHDCPRTHRLQFGSKRRIDHHIEAGTFEVRIDRDFPGVGSAADLPIVDHPDQRT